jgi:hypothetical protein
MGPHDFVPMASSSSPAPVGPADSNVAFLPN